MKRVVVVCAVGLALGGCKTAAERQQAQMAQDTAACARLGATPGSEREFQCKLALETQRRNADAAYGAADYAQQQSRTQAFANQLMFGRR